MHRYATFEEAINYLARNYKRYCLWSILRLGMNAYYVFRSEPTEGGLDSLPPAANNVSLQTTDFGRFNPYYGADAGPGRHSEELLIENFHGCLHHWRDDLAKRQIGKVRHDTSHFWPPRIGIINSHTPCISGLMNRSPVDQKPSTAREIQGWVYPESCAFKLATLRAGVPQVRSWELSWFAVHKYGEVTAKSGEQWQEAEIKRCLVPLGFQVGRVSESERQVAKEANLKL